MQVSYMHHNAYRVSHLTYKQMYKNICTKQLTNNSEEQGLKPEQVTVLPFHANMETEL